MALPVATKESLPIYQNYPDETFLEYLISFTDGNHWYYVGIIVATSYQHKKGTAPESFTIEYLRDGLIINVDNQPMSLFSESQLIPRNQQLELIKALLLPTR